MICISEMHRESDHDVVESPDQKTLAFLFYITVNGMFQLIRRVFSSAVQTITSGFTG